MVLYFRDGFICYSGEFIYFYNIDGKDGGIIYDEWS